MCSSDLRLIPQNKAIILYCRSGNRSTDLMHYLKHNGFLETNHLEGGVLAWVKEVEINEASY